MQSPSLSTAPHLAQVTALVAARGREAWPQLDVATEALRRFLETRAGTLLSEPDRIQAEDLYLACACLERSEGALQTFEQRFRGVVRAATRRLAPETLSADDVMQQLAERLFLGGDARPPALESYSGTGSLEGWLRMTAVRLLLSLRRAHASPEVAEEGELLALPDAQTSPELQVIRQQYRDEFRSAFELAMSHLEPKERSVLREQVLFRMTLEQIAALHQVGRATVARWLSSARHRLLVETRENLAERLGANRTEVESLIEVLHSQLDLSIERLLASKG